MKPRVIWCLGMYASASTWAFNVTRQIADAAGAGPVRTHFFADQAYFAGFDEPGTVQIVKSHEIKSEAAVLELSRRATEILVTMRDPRDAVTSLMLYHGYEFERAMPLVAQAARLVMGFARDKRALLLHYESGFADEAGTVALIAARLGVALDAGAAARIFADHRRAAVEAYIAGMDGLPGTLRDRVSGDMLDPRTHWHTHHAGRDGEIGRWRHRLTPAQAAAVRDRLADCYNFAD